MHYSLENGSAAKGRHQEAVHDVFSRGFTDDPLHGRYGDSSRLRRDSDDATPIAGELLRLDRRHGTATVRMTTGTDRRWLSLSFACRRWNDV